MVLRWTHKDTSLILQKSWADIERQKCKMVSVPYMDINQTLVMGKLPIANDSQNISNRMYFPTKGGPWRCTVEGCPGHLATRTATRVQFLQRHVQDTVVMLEEGNLPHPRCTWCDMQVPRKALNGRHLGTAQCAKGAERKRRRLAEMETRENLERALHAFNPFPLSLRVQPPFPLDPPTVGLLCFFN